MDLNCEICTNFRENTGKLSGEIGRWFYHGVFASLINFIRRGLTHRWGEKYIFIKVFLKFYLNY